MSWKRLCIGYLKKANKCEYIDNCDLCMLLDVDDECNEIYACGLGVPDFKCKRDNPDFRQMTKSEFLKTYKQMPVYKRYGMGLSEVMEWAISIGLVEND